jgi:hypothetical protein
VLCHGLTDSDRASLVHDDDVLKRLLPKRGTETGEGRRFAGTRYLADIGIPASVCAEIGVRDVPCVPAGTLLRLD